MVLFVSQAPVMAVLIPVVLLIALFEIVELKVRRNILMLSILALICLVAAVPVSANHPALASLLYAAGAMLAIVLSFYAIMTARRGKQRIWFVGLLAVAAATLVVAIAMRLAAGAQNADAATFILTFVPAIGALLYGVFAPDIPKPRGGMV